MVKVERIDDCEVCGKKIDNSYRKARKTCGNPKCIKEKKRRYSAKAHKKLKKEHRCWICCKPVELVKPKPYYPTRCSCCSKRHNINNIGKGRK